MPYGQRVLPGPLPTIRWLLLAAVRYLDHGEQVWQFDRTLNREAVSRDSLGRKSQESDAPARLAAKRRLVRERPTVIFVVGNIDNVANRSRSVDSRRFQYQASPSLDPR